MTAAQTHITPSTPMGATLVDGGATFRVWAPAASAVHVALDDAAGYVPSPADELVKDPATGHWTGFFPVVAGQDIRPYRVAKFLDVLERVEYLADLGINAIQPLPVVEFHGPWSVGYNGTDIFSPEMDYCVDPADLEPYLRRVNALLANKGCAPLTASQLSGQVNQLKAFIDIFHLYGIAVIVDVVYNHAGGDLDPQSIDYFDLPSSPGAENNLYFSAAGWAGGRVFKFSEPGVCSFLTYNARMFLEEYHADGLRFDEVRVIQWNGGRPFCQQLTETLRWLKPEAVLIAEYWEEPRAAALWPPPAGLGFDAEYSDLLRDRVREGGIPSVRWCVRGRRHRSPGRRAAAAVGRALRVAGLQLRGEPRSAARPGGRRTSPAARAAAGGPAERPLLVRAKPLARRDRPPSHRPRRARAVHGTGVPRGQALVGQPATE
jgi:hypothetical protein